MQAVVPGKKCMQTRTESRNYKVKEIFPQQKLRFSDSSRKRENNLSKLILSRKQPEIEAIHNKIAEDSTRQKKFLHI